MATAYVTDQLACQQAIKVAMLPRAIEFTEKVLNSNAGKTSELDCNARIVYMNLRPKLEFVNVSLQKYPQNITMLKLRGYLLRVERKMDQSLQDYETILKCEPRNYSSMFQKAASLLQMNRSEEAAKNFKLYLSVAPKDDRMYPEAYYGLAQCAMKDSDDTDMYFKKGLASEKEQLPCFLPYQSDRRDGLKMQLEMIDVIVGASKQSKHSRKKEKTENPPKM